MRGREKPRVLSVCMLWLVSTLQDIVHKVGKSGGVPSKKLNINIERAILGEY